MYFLLLKAYTLKTNPIYITMISKKCVSLFYILIFFVSGILAQEKFVLVIDAGHGGSDPGAVGAISKEKDLNLAVALKLGKLIEDNHQNEVKVIYTRKTDVFPTLFERAELANKNKANLFISIHTNAAKNKSASGTETIIFGLSRSESNLEVAMRENSVILLEDDYQTRYEGFNPTSVESYIMFEFMQNKYMENSANFASSIQSRFAKDCKRIDRGVKESAIIVLHRSACPAVLVELGFISNAAEERYMNSAKGQDELTRAIYNAFVDYKREYDKKSIIATTAKPAAPIENQNNEAPVFKVQFISSKEKLKSNDSRLKGISNVECYIENGYHKHTTGKTSSYVEIQNIKREVQNQFPDAFVIAFLGNKKITVGEAMKILENR